jgi:hypothetical protein
LRRVQNVRFLDCLTDLFGKIGEGGELVDVDADLFEERVQVLLDRSRDLVLLAPAEALAEVLGEDQLCLRPLQREAVVVREDPREEGEDFRPLAFRRHEEAEVVGVPAEAVTPRRQSLVDVVDGHLGD